MEAKDVKDKSSSQEVFPLYAKVYVDIDTKRINRPFTYGIPQDLKDRIYVGAPVRVSFRKRIITGYVVEMTQHPGNLSGNIRILPLLEVIPTSSLWDREMLELARWIEGYYASGFLQSLKVLIPGPVRPRMGESPGRGMVRKICLGVPFEEAVAVLGNKAQAQSRTVEFLKDGMPRLLSEVVDGAAVSYGTLRALKKKKVLREVLDYPSPVPLQEAFEETETTPELTEDQSLALSRLHEMYEEDKAGVALLHGITGSGKTEVYLRMVSFALERGREALILVPEISLTPQAIQRFEARFGSDVAVLHSRLTDQERRQMWWKIKEGRARVVLGARSAIFAPLERIGVIVVDEEHEASYKQESEPRYHARQVAIRRALTHKALVILGSATPSLEVYHWAKSGKYEYLELPRRIGESKLPRIDLVDLKKDLPPREKDSPGQPPVIGDTLRQEMTKVMGRGEQVILFLNRRGFAAFILCRECGNVIRCPNCDITLTFHKTQRLIKCHYCDYSRPAPDICPICRGTELKPLSLGTQRVEEELKQAFPGVGVIRMDKDTTRGREDHYNLLKAFSNRNAHILLGTQMVAKGLDFPGVTLVGVILADVSLYLPDFRSLERTYQLLTQVSGRAGRRDMPGRVIIQTYSPDSPVFQAVARQDYDSFFLWESENRRELNYPPFAHLVNLIFTGVNDQKTREYAMKFADVLGSGKFKDIFIAVLGPAPCFLSRIQGKYRWHVTLKGASGARMSAVIRALADRISIPSDVGFSVDVDPVSMM